MRELVTKQIDAVELISEWPRYSRDFALIDVRSEGEFDEAQLPGFVSLPILNNEERHKVGLCYKEQGQDQAIQLGYELVRETRNDRIERWSRVVRAANSRVGVVTCWRGGLRSKIASEWLAEAGVEVLQLRGGYKALRRVLLESYEVENLPRFVVLAGPTGSGKTELLRSLELPKIDLEAHARHRGSSFGGFVGHAQPSQASFENTVAMDLRLQSARRSQSILIEDESIMIGHRALPAALKAQIDLSPLCVLEVPLEERSRKIFREYVERPCVASLELALLESSLRKSLDRIRGRLGGLRHREISESLAKAFNAPLGHDDLPTFDAHREWIQALLVYYYDPRYQYGLEKPGRKVAYRGTLRECHEWLTQNMRAAQ